MKNITNFIYIVLSLVIVSCNNSTTEIKTELKETKLRGLFSFAQTEDRNLCNPEMIVGSDCAGGDLYFADNKTVIYMFYCQGQDSISYEIGNYVDNDTVIKCNFTNSYSYLYSEEDTLNQEIQNGVMQTLNKQSTLTIKPLKCAEFPFYLTLKWEGEGEYNYVLKKSDSASTNYFLTEMNKIKPFDKHLKNNCL